jgi:hypothetical protein
VEEIGADDTSARRRQQHLFFRVGIKIKARKETFGPTDCHGWRSAFHEKAGMSQECFFFPSCGFLTFEPGRPVAILPSALLVERFSLGA